MDLTHVLLNILLILLGLIGIGVIIALALAISALLQVFALARTVRTEVSAIGSAIRGIGDGVSGKLGGALDLMGLFKKKPVKRTTKK